MIEIKMTLDGLDELRKAFAEAGEEVRRKVEAVVTKTTIDVHRSAVQRIQRGPKTGNVYTKYDPNREHQASAPGEAPATDTGRLASSVSWNVDRERGGFVYTNVDYGRILEFGTTNIGPRPWLFPSLEEHAPAFRKALTEVLKK
jgi:HK97 gp10 family phage protein